MEYKIFTDGNDSIIAESVDEAILAWNDTIGDRYIENGYGTYNSWYERKPEEFIVLTFVDEKDVPSSAAPDNAIIDGNTAKATVKDWVFHQTKFIKDGDCLWFSSQEW